MIQFSSFEYYTIYAILYSAEQEKKLNVVRRQYQLLARNAFIDVVPMCIMHNGAAHVSTYRWYCNYTSFNTPQFITTKFNTN